MTPRERIKKLINFKKPDELPWCEDIWDETLYIWNREKQGKLQDLNLETKTHWFQ